MRDSMKKSVFTTVDDLFHSGLMDEITLRDIKSIGLPEIKPYSPRRIVSIR